MTRSLWYNLINNNYQYSIKAKYLHANFVFLMKHYWIGGRSIPKGIQCLLPDSYVLVFLGKFRNFYRTYLVRGTVQLCIDSACYLCNAPLYLYMILYYNWCRQLVYSTVHKFWRDLTIFIFSMGKSICCFDALWRPFVRIQTQIFDFLEMVMRVS